MKYIIDYLQITILIIIIIVLPIYGLFKLITIDAPEDENK